MTQKTDIRSATDELRTGSTEGGEQERGKDWGGPKDYRSGRRCPPHCTCTDPNCCDGGCCCV